MTWLVIGAIGLATYGLRASFLLRGGEGQASMERHLRYVPVAVLPALAVGATLGQGGEGLDLRLAAAAVAALVAWRTRNAALAMGLGMIALWALSASLG